jgi:hypothetical protein
MDKKYLTEETVHVIHWDKVPSGTYFTAMYRSKMIDGLIFNDVEHKKIYLCQNAIESAHDELRRLGFFSAYPVDYADVKTTDDLANVSYSVKNLELSDMPEGYEVPDLPIKIGEHIVNLGIDKFIIGCTQVSFDIVEELYRRMLKHKKRLKEREEIKL